MKNKAPKCKKTRVKMELKKQRCNFYSQNGIHFELFCYLQYNITVDNRDNMARVE